MTQFVFCSFQILRFKHGCIPKTSLLDAPKVSWKFVVGLVKHFPNVFLLNLCLCQGQAFQLRQLFWRILTTNVASLVLVASDVYTKGIENDILTSWILKRWMLQLTYQFCISYIDGHCATCCFCHTRPCGKNPNGLGPQSGFILDHTNHPPTTHPPQSSMFDFFKTQS